MYIRREVSMAIDIVLSSTRKWRTMIPHGGLDTT
jgi:hypothetical protein